jgi:hypothetical protein
VVERFYREHKDALDAYERRVRAHRADQIRSQRIRLAETDEGRRVRLDQIRQLLQQRRQESNGEGTRS